MVTELGNQISKNKNRSLINNFRCHENETQPHQGMIKNTFFSAKLRVSEKDGATKTR